MVDNVSTTSTSEDKTLGWSVLTRPSIISGKPVKSETSMTGRPASLRVFAVPPVDRT